MAVNNSKKELNTTAFTPETPLQIKVSDSGSQLSVTDKQQIAYVLVDLRPPKTARKKSVNAPLNACLVLDRSTSMRGDRLRQARSAVNLVIEKLSPKDTVSVISYSDRAEVVIPATHPAKKDPLYAKVRTISASGGTEIYQGLAAGIAQMRQVSLDKHINHLILLTDGHTYGDADKCLSLAEKAAARGIGFSAFGIGTDWNDAFLDSLVTPSGGQSGYIENPEQIIHYLRQRIQGLGAIYGHDVHMRLQTPPQVKFKDAFKLTPFAQPLKTNQREIQLGSVEARVPLSILLEFAIDGTQDSQQISLQFGFTADIPQLEDRKAAFKHQHAINVASSKTEDAMPTMLVQAVQILNLYRMNEQAWADAKAGRITEATTRMERLTQRFKEAGMTELAKHAQSETQRLTQEGSLSMAGRMTLKYGTRTHMTNSLNLGLTGKSSSELRDE